MIEIFIAHPDEKFVGLYRPHLPQSFNLDSASDGLTAVRKLRLKRPNLILSSDVLPHLSGLALLKFVRDTEHLHNVPFIFISDQPADSTALGLGANDWLSRQDMLPQDILEKIYYHLRINR